MTEWSEARNSIGRFDGYVADLRKYGFTFVTGLLAITGFLSQSGTAGLTPPIKSGILLTTLALLITLFYLDKQWRMFQRAASIRARILERELNLDLTDAIARYYGADLLRFGVQRVYYGLLLSTAILGAFVLWPSGWSFSLSWNPLSNELWPAFLEWWPLILLVSGLLVGVSTIRDIDKWTLTRGCDWSVTPKVATVGDLVRVTFTSLVEDPSASSLWTSCEVERADGSPILDLIGQACPARGSKGWNPTTERLELMYLEGRSWVWDTEGYEPGLYELKGLSTLILRPSLPGRTSELFRGLSQRIRDYLANVDEISIAVLGLPGISVSIRRNVAAQLASQMKTTTASMRAQQVAENVIGLPLRMRITVMLTPKPRLGDNGHPSPDGR